MAKKYNKDPKFERCFELYKLLKTYSAHLDDRLETYLELVDNEFIPHDTFSRMCENELLGTINELENYLSFYKGLQ